MQEAYDLSGLNEEAAQRQQSEEQKGELEIGD